MNRNSICSILTLLFIFSIISLNAQPNKNFSYSPTKPHAGKKILVTYNPTGTKLENAKSISMLIHAYGKAVYYTNEIELKKEGKTWKGNFSAADSCAGVVLRFTDGKEYDNNGTKCYPIRFYNKDGKYVQYASGGLAAGYINWFNALEVDPDAETALKLCQEEVSLYPSSMKDIFLSYYRAYNKTDKIKAAEFLKTEAEKFEKTLTQSEEDLALLAQVYNFQGNKEKAAKTQELILQNYPTGKTAEGIKFQELYGTKDAAKKAELANKFKEQFPNSQYIAYLFPDPSQALIKAGKFEEAYEAIKKNPKATSGSYNNLAWAMYEKGADLKLAKEVAAKGVELSKTEDPLQGSTMPPYYSKNQFIKMTAAQRYAIIDTYGAILLKAGENAEALKQLKHAYELNDGESADVNERYAQALIANGKEKEALDLLKKSISGGKSTNAMKDLLKQAYVKIKGSETGFDKYISDIESAAQKSTLEELKKNMLDMPAPQFTLTDLNGNKVSLTELKGKIVIVDFWATWCGPCKASFPGMQKTVNKFASDPDVKFLFINTWERNVADKKKNAQDFITQNKYTFQVLLDLDDKVIDSYKVSGIPTKFIVDKNGKIRFKNVGFDGSDDKLVQELSSMISMLK